MKGKKVRKFLKIVDDAKLTFQILNVVKTKHTHTHTHTHTLNFLPKRISDFPLVFTENLEVPV